nr:MAG TPA: FeoB-associated Cys-rich membrane protein [Caudoviricetes sp.]
MILSVVLILLIYHEFYSLFKKKKKNKDFKNSVCVCYATS